MAIQLEGAITPGDVGKVLTRAVRVADHYLVIQLDTTAADGTPVVRTLTFDRADTRGEKE